MKNNNPNREIPPSGAFLYNIAKTFYENHGDEISDFTFVFPNRRSGLFFRKYLGEIIEKPIFSPNILTINELFISQSSFQTADKLGLLFHIYEIYKKLSKNDETFDVFAYWGEMLLADFDDVDKYMVDAKQLFTNIKDIKEIDNLFDFLSPEQVEVIRTFWNNFLPGKEGKKQQDFISTWEILYPIYEQFRKELSEKNLAYEGMIYRDVVEKMKAPSNSPEGGEQFSPFGGIEGGVVFIGFNALTPCEKELFKYLKKRNKADFYWDYYSEKTKETENLASLFYQENTYSFPSKYDIEIPPLIPPKGGNYPAPSGELEGAITLIGIPSSVGQTKEVYQILKDLHLNKKTAFETAVVLPEEKLLLPLLHSLPNDIENINVTMGYPLSSTPLSGLIDYLFELQLNTRKTADGILFYHKDVLSILNHQYIFRTNESGIKNIIKDINRRNRFYLSPDELGKTDLLKAIFQIKETPREFTQYLVSFLEELQVNLSVNEEDKKYTVLEKEYLYHYLITIKRTNDLLKNQEIEMNLDTIFRLLRKIISGINIPFSGEPLSGLQIMGVLETRSLDFKNLIITSMNEGVFPKKQSAPSFIPYNLRKGFGMPTAEHQDAIYAYHFYRLIHRAENIYFLYDTRTDGLQSGEVSRFIHQLNYHYKWPMKEKLVTYDISIDETQSLKIEKTPEVMKKLSSFLKESGDRMLSASAINNYLDCPLKFYFATVEKLSETDEVKESVEANDFGTIFHAVMQYIYDEQPDKKITSEKLEEIRKNDIYLDKIIRKAFAEKYLFIAENKVKIEGQYFIIASIIKKYVKQLLQKDKEYAPFFYVKSEYEFKTSFPVFNDEKQVNLRGFIDRIDEKDGITRIMDYKTGKVKSDKFSSIAELFESGKDNRPKEILQLFMYALLYRPENKTDKIMPTVISLRKLFDPTENFSIKYAPARGQKILVEDFSLFKDEFESCFTACLEEIFDEETPFCQTENDAFCQYCSFTGICKR